MSSPSSISRGTGSLATGGLFGYVFLFPTPQFVSPGISIPLMLVATLLLGVVVYFVYAALGSAMPRAGGDYLYESRTLHPLVGFTVPWACQLLFWLAFPAVRGLCGDHLRARADLPGVRSHGSGELAAHRDGDVHRRPRSWSSSCWLLTVYGLRIYRPSSATSWSRRS